MRSRKERRINTIRHFSSLLILRVPPPMRWHKARRINTGATHSSTTASPRRLRFLISRRSPISQASAPSPPARGADSLARSPAPTSPISPPPTSQRVPQVSTFPAMLALSPMVSTPPPSTDSSTTASRPLPQSPASRRLLISLLPKAKSRISAHTKLRLLSTTRSLAR